MKTVVIIFSLGFLFSQAVSAAASAEAIFQQTCKKCHGLDGKGQTTVGKKLKVPDFTNPEWQAKNSPSKMKEVIENGVKDKAGKELMAPYKNKLTSEEINNLIEYVKKFASSNT